MKPRTWVPFLVGGLITFASTHSTQGAPDWAFFSPFSLPGLVVAAPSAFFRNQGDTSAANVLIVNVVDFIFYTALLYWLLNRWDVTRE